MAQGQDIQRRPAPKDLDDVKLWIADHDARIDAWWQEQKTWNVKFEKEVRATQHGFDIRLSAVEKRMIYVAGFGAGVGSILFNVARDLFRG